MTMMSSLCSTMSTYIELTVYNDEELTVYSNDQHIELTVFNNEHMY